MVAATAAHLNLAVMLWCAFGLCLCLRKCRRYCLFAIYCLQKGVEEEVGAATKCNDVQYRIWDDATHVEINVPHNNACQTLED